MRVRRVDVERDRGERILMERFWALRFAQGSWDKMSMLWWGLVILGRQKRA